MLIRILIAQMSQNNSLCILVNIVPQKPLCSLQFHMSPENMSPLDVIIKIVIQHLVGIIGFDYDIVEILETISDVLRICGVQDPAHIGIRYQKTEARNIMNQRKTLNEKATESGIANISDSFIWFVDF